MRIDETREDDAAAQVDRAGVRPDELRDLAVRTGRDDGVAAQCERLHHRPAGIFRVYLAVQEHEFGRRRGGCGGGRERQCTAKCGGDIDESAFHGLSSAAAAWLGAGRARAANATIAAGDEPTGGVPAIATYSAPWPPALPQR